MSQLKEVDVIDAILDAHLLEQQRDYLMDIFKRMATTIGEEEITVMRPYLVEMRRMTLEGMFFQEHHVYKDAATFVGE